MSKIEPKRSLNTNSKATPILSKRKTRSTTNVANSKTPAKSIQKKNLKIVRKRKAAPALITSKRAKVSEEESQCDLRSISLRSGKKTSSISVTPKKSKTPLKTLKKTKSSKNPSKCTPVPKKEKSTDMHNSATGSEEHLSQGCPEDLLITNSVPPSVENIGRLGDIPNLPEDACPKEEEEAKDDSNEVQQSKSESERN